MSAPLENYLKTHRRRSGLSQDEMAFLLGSSTGTKISRYERHARRPTLKTALAYEAIFQVPASAIFAGLYQKVEKETATRAQLLSRKLAQSRHRKTTLHKLVFLEAVCAGRAANCSRRS